MRNRPRPFCVTSTRPSPPRRPAVSASATRRRSAGAGLAAARKAVALEASSRSGTAGIGTPSWSRTHKTVTGLRGGRRVGPVWDRRRRDAVVYSALNAASSSRSLCALPPRPGWGYPGAGAARRVPPAVSDRLQTTRYTRPSRLIAATRVVERPKVIISAPSSTVLKAAWRRRAAVALVSAVAWASWTKSFWSRASCLTCIIHEGRASVGDGRDLAAKRGLARDARMPAGFEEGVMGPGGRGRPSSETALVEREPFCPRPEAYDARPAG